MPWWRFEVHSKSSTTELCLFKVGQISSGFDWDAGFMRNTTYLYGKSIDSDRSHSLFMNKSTAFLANSFSFKQSLAISKKSNNHLKNMKKKQHFLTGWSHPYKTKNKKETKSHCFYSYPSWPALLFKVSTNKINSKKKCKLDFYFFFLLRFSYLCFEFTQYITDKIYVHI